MDSSSPSLKLGTEEQFSEVRQFLQASGYFANNICERLGVEHLALFEGLQPRTESWTTKDALNVLISLFALGERVSRADAEVLPERTITAFRSLGLVADLDAETLFAPVSIGPVEELFFVSDRWCSPDGSPFQIADDAVYPAITPNTLKFLATVPLSPCEALLDVGTGTGVGALTGAASYAKRAWAFDITERSAKFTEFNCRLNGIRNVSVGQGDLYAPAGDATFDRIIAHPPYVPVLTHHWTFHDGGDDGEFLTRRLVEGLPRHLRPGGTFHCYAMGSDREAPFEQRVRSWLGDSEAEFDVELIVKNQMDPMQFASQTVLKHEASNFDLGKWKRLFEDSRTRKLVFGTITVRRLEEPRRAVSVRRVGGEWSGRREAEWLLTMESVLAQGTERVLQWRPKLSNSVCLIVQHRVEEGEFSPAHYELKTEYPFVTGAEIPAWAGMFLARCNGERTTQELLDALKAEGYLKAQVQPEDFAELVASFIGRGFVEVRELPLPLGMG